MKTSKGRRIGLVIAVLMLVAGVLVLIYPKITDGIYQMEVKQMKEEFSQQLGTADSSGEEQENTVDVEGLYQELQRRNQELYTGHQKNITDPFSFEQQGIDLAEYGLEGNVIGFISIPKMEVELPILLGASKENMKLGAVHLTETSYPVGGVNTNCVIAAHRGYSKTPMFRQIQKLELGDKIYLRTFRETLVYEVSELRIIEPTDMNTVLIQEGKDMVTLFTCHPYPHNYQRYVVFCERAEG